MVSKQPQAGQLAGRLEAEDRLGGSGLAWMLGLGGEAELGARGNWRDESRAPTAPGLTA